MDQPQEDSSQTLILNITPPHAHVPDEPTPTGDGDVELQGVSSQASTNSGAPFHAQLPGKPTHEQADLEEALQAYLDLNPTPEQIDLDDAIQSNIDLNVMEKSELELDSNLVADSSSYINDYMVNIKPDVEAAKEQFKKLKSEDKALVVSDHFSKLGSNHKIDLVVGWLNLCQNYEWVATLMQTRMRQVRFDILGNLPGDLLQQVADYLDPEHVVRCMRVCKKWATILSSPDFSNGQLASHFGVKVKAPAHPESPPGPDIYYAMTQRFHRQKMGRPTDMFQYRLPDSEGTPLDFRKCQFDYHQGRLAFLESRGGALRALWLVSVFTLAQYCVYAFPPEPLESIVALKMSQNLVVCLSVFNRCYVFDVSEPDSPRSHFLKLPSGRFKALLVLGNKVVLVFFGMICCWDTSDQTLRTFTIGTPSGWVMIHPTREEFLTVVWEFQVTAFGSYLTELVTTTYSWTKGKIRNVVRTLVNVPPLGAEGCTNTSELIHRPCFKDATRYVSLYSAIADYGSMNASGLLDYLIDHDFTKNKVSVRTLDTQGFVAFTGNLPSEFHTSFLLGGLLCFFHPDQRFSQYTYNIHEEDASKSFVVPEYLDFMQNPAMPRSRFRHRHTFTDGKYLVMINEYEESIQVWSYEEGITTPFIDMNYRVLAAHRAAERGQDRFLAGLEGQWCKLEA